MPSYQGVVRKNPVEGGVWELHASDGERYQLRGGDAGLRREGQQVKVTGKIDKGGFGIGMTGPILDVTSWKAEGDGKNGKSDGKKGGKAR
jgi:hypothetical protein